MKIETELTEERLEEIVYGLFITAWYGGSSYWAEVSEPNGAEKTLLKMKNEGHVLRVTPIDDDPVDVTYEDLLHGIVLLARDFTQSYHDVLNDYDDAETADIWFQLAVLGELTYG